MILTRRRALLLLAAPAIVRAASLMPIFAPRPTIVSTDWSHLVVSSERLAPGYEIEIMGKLYRVVAVVNGGLAVVDRPVR